MDWVQGKLAKLDLEDWKKSLKSLSFRPKFAFHASRLNVADHRADLVGLRSIDWETFSHIAVGIEKSVKLCDCEHDDLNVGRKNQVPSVQPIFCSVSPRLTVYWLKSCIRYPVVSITMCHPC